jgi:hypothetical protein
MLTDAAARRLTIYCRRKAPRELVMRDREVREALQAADEDFDA